MLMGDNGFGHKRKNEEKNVILEATKSAKNKKKLEAHYIYGFGHNEE